MASEGIPSPPMVEQTLLEWGFQVHPFLVPSVIHYLEILEKWNRQINLTGLRSADEILRLHFAESFFAAQHLERNDTPLLDVGSGAGFPGLAIKLVQPALPVYLVEPRKKKAVFLAEVRRELGLTQVSILNKTLEECQWTDFPIAPGVLTLRGLGEAERRTRRGLTFLGRPSQVMLFSTTGQVLHLRDHLPEVDWKDPVPIPWSRERVLLIGRKR